jgi:AcrR family transcriptional regulator
VVRITADKKAETRREILVAARNLFNNNGFEQTSTREIAARAGIAAGTLFNYFPTKETLAMTLIAESLDEGRREFDAGRRPGESLEESLFGHVAVGLRHLRPCRSYLGEVIETAMSLFTASGANGPGEAVRTEHLDTVRRLITERAAGGTTEPSSVTMHLYWSLYLGVLAYWSRDESENQEDTLAVLDEAIQLFVRSLAGEPSPETTDGNANR